MGQYWKVVNLDKREFIVPHKLGSGLKLWEQLANSPGPGEALIVLCAAMPEARGGGDFDLDANWHGPERKFPEHGSCPGPMPEEYADIAHRTIGRWAGDRIALAGDYAEDSDLPTSPIPFSQVYSVCVSPDEAEFEGTEKPVLWTDISEDVAAVIEHELGGKYVGDGWKNWENKKDTA